MPIYEYECNACGEQHEFIQKFSDSPKRKCPACGKSRLRKLISAAAFHLKGSGWYVTDFRDGEKKPSADGDSDAPSSDSESSNKSEDSSSASETTSDSGAQSGTKGEADSASKGKSKKKADTKSAGKKKAASSKAANS